MLIAIMMKMIMWIMIFMIIRIMMMLWPGINMKIKGGTR